jgi:hypothetical protein
VIVTWSADYNTTGTSVVGLALNGGPCRFYGPFTLQEPQLIAGSNSITVATTHQWVVLPSDGLVKGKNTFQMCGGGYKLNQIINIGFSKRRTPYAHPVTVSVGSMGFLMRWSGQLLFRDLLPRCGRIAR